MKKVFYAVVAVVVVVLAILSICTVNAETVAVSSDIAEASSEILDVSSEAVEETASFDSTYDAVVTTNSSMAAAAAEVTSRFASETESKDESKLYTSSGSVVSEKATGTFTDKSKDDRTGELIVIIGIGTWILLLLIVCLLIVLIISKKRKKKNRDLDRKERLARQDERFSDEHYRRY